MPTCHALTAQGPEKSAQNMARAARASGNVSVRAVGRCDIACACIDIVETTAAGYGQVE